MTDHTKTLIPDPYPWPEWPWPKGSSLDAKNAAEIWAEVDAEERQVESFQDAVRDRLRAAAQAMDADLPRGTWPADRPAGYPAHLPWPPEGGPAALAAFEAWDAEIKRPAEEAEAAAAAEWEAALIRGMEATLADAAANDMPLDRGAAVAELARRLLRSRDYQVFDRELKERLADRDDREPTAPERVRWDLEITKMAARETRHEPFLYDFLCRFSWFYPDYKKAPSFAEYDGYITGTVRKALAAAPPAFPATPGRTVAELMEDPDVLTPPVAVVPRLAWRGRDTLLAGREKLAGKSTLLTAAAAAVTTGGLFLGEKAAKGHVLWVSADQEPEPDIVQRFLRFGGEPDRMTIAYPGGDFGARLDRLVADVARRDPALVVVDSLSMFALVEEASQAAEWNARLGAMRERLKPYDAARVWVHHTTKGTQEYRDSTAIGAAVDQILYYENPDPRGGTAARKVWGLGRIVGWRPFDVRLGDDAFEVDTSERDRGDAMDANEDEAIRAWVEAHPGCTTTDVAGGTRRRKGEATAALARLQAAGKVEDRGDDHAYAWHCVPTGGNDSP